MSYQAKYLIALVVLIIGCVLVILGAGEARGSMGMQEIVSSAVWKLGIGFVLVLFGGPLFYYYRARKHHAQVAADTEIAMLAAIGQKNLDAQDAAEKAAARPPKH